MENSYLMSLKYPIGKFTFNEDVTSEKRNIFIQEIADAPAKLREAVIMLNEQQLDTPYRPDGWTVRQVIHHLPDSHMNAYVRMKLALTEDVPTIKPYEEHKWAELKDTFITHISVSLNLLEALHKRWINLIKSLPVTDFKRNFKHPEHGLVSLEWMLAQYAWHGKHHVAHITSLKERMGWK